MRTTIWIGVLLAGACGDSGTAGPSPGSGADTVVAAAVLLDAIDIGNTGTATDLQVTLRRSLDHAEIAEYRLVVYADPGPVPTREEILALPADRYLAVYPDETPAPIGFPETSVDVEGMPLAEGTAYRVVSLAVPDSVEKTSPVSGRSPVVVLEQASYITTLTEIDAGTGGLALDDDGNLYMGDFGATLDGPPGQVVYRIRPNGEVDIYAQGFQGASGNAFDTEGNLYQSSIVGGYVSRITPDGTVDLRHVDALTGPVGIISTPEGGLYIADCSANAVVHVDAGRTVTTYSASALLACPNGIARGPDGTLYVANFSNGNVIEITPDGDASVFAQLSGGNNGHITLAGDRLYVAARGGNQLYELTLEGEATLLAGTGERGLRDGTALDAQLSLTNDVVVSADGRTIYFNDVAGSGNRVISPVAVRVLHLLEGG